ncbi:MAG: hypothetical protein F4Z08_06690 [Chloroflexi bacterium]|nr:hypothetical protein [Chloroflexota bacterium]MXZ46661.1 hypothetical protein [Chloroflexota bacterium]
MAVLFDTLRASQELREAGFEARQADAMVSAFAGAMFGNVATKDDVSALRDDLTALKGDLIALEERLDHRLTIRFGAMVAGAVAIMLAALSIVTAILLAAG